MDAKSNDRYLRVSKNVVKYVTRGGERLRFPVLMYNTPRVSGRRTGGDRAFLKDNNLSKVL